jgi:hypothetical protein
MPETLFIPRAVLAEPPPAPPQEDRLWRLRRLFFKEGSQHVDPAARAEGADLPNARVTFRYCPVCGLMEWSSSGVPTEENPAGLVLCNWLEESRYWGDGGGCTNCMEVHHRNPEVAAWVLGVARTHGHLTHKLPPIDKVS